jgi:hypothetical protein
MDLRSLQAEILSGPKSSECKPYVNDGSDPSRKASAPSDDQAIAALLSAGRTKIASRQIDDRDVAIALGIPGGPVFLYQLEQAALSAPGPDATAQQIALCAIARQAWRSITRGTFEVGNPVVRDAVDSMVGVLLTADQSAAIKALAEVPEQVSAADVSRAMRGPWGDE